jgi:flagellar protein FlgJ
MIPPVTQGAMAAPTVSSTARQMAGMLWYTLLTEMSKNGMDASALGDGGAALNGMFLWNIAQNDFGKYDGALTAATVEQLGGRVAMAQAPSVAAAGAVPGAVTDEVNNAAPLIGVAQEALAVPDAGAPAASLLAQAQNFTKSIWPQIQAAASSLGVPPEAVLAQAALETGWGVAASGNNLFGIKAVAGQAGSLLATHEDIDGVLTPTAARFRDYGSVSESAADYVRLLRGGFSNAVGQASVSGFARALQDGGYATDGDYAAKIIAIAQSPAMKHALEAVGKIP